MRESRPQSIENLLDAAEGQHALQSVQQRAVALNKLNRALRSILPVQLRPWCRVANFRQGLLVLETANASWMMRLRYEQSSLISALRAQIVPSLTAIDIRINPSLAVKKQENAQKSDEQHQHELSGRYLSEESARTLRNVAVNSPKKLREAIERLVSRAGESTNATSRNRKN